MNTPFQQSRSIYCPLQYITRFLLWISSQWKFRFLNLRVSEKLYLLIFYQWTSSIPNYFPTKLVRNSRRMPRFQGLTHCQNMEVGEMEHIKITTETATILVLMAPLVLGVLLECQRHCSLHPGKLGAWKLPSLYATPHHLHTHSSVVGLHSEKPRTLSLLRGELLYTHIPRPHLGSPTGVFHIWIWAVLGASPEHVHFLFTCYWPPRAPCFPAASLG